MCVPPILGKRQEITWTFGCPIAPHLWPLLNRQIFTVAHYTSSLAQSARPNPRHTWTPKCPIYFLPIPRLCLKTPPGFPSHLTLAMNSIRPGLMAEGRVIQKKNSLMDLMMSCPRSGPSAYPPEIRLFLTVSEASASQLGCCRRTSCLCRLYRRYRGSCSECWIDSRSRARGEESPTRSRR